MIPWELPHLLHYMGVIVLLLIAAIVLAFFFAPAHRTWDKVSPYECGFHPFEDARKEFNIHFYLIALLFVAFDLEVLLLLPWVTNLSALDTWAYWFGCLFLLLLLIGFIYEWQTGALTW